MCPSSVAPLQESSVCKASTNNLASIPILENSGQIYVHFFVRQLSAGSGVPNQMSLFGFEEEANSSAPDEGNLTFLETRLDPHAALPGLEEAVDFSVSPDGAHAYVAEFDSNTLAVLDHSKGDGGMRFIDRRAEGENRLRFQDSVTFQTQNPCSAKMMEQGDETFLALMQECEVLVKDKEHLPSYVQGDVSAKHAKVEEYGYLGQRTIAYWKQRVDAWTVSRTQTNNGGLSVPDGQKH